MKNQTILILDFGGQYKELIARRIRECNVYSIVKPCGISVSEIKAIDPIGIVLTGGPRSVYQEDSPSCDPEIFHIGIPVLGICYGMQWICFAIGGTVAPSEKREYGLIALTVKPDSVLFEGMEKEQTVLMSHTDQVVRLPKGFRATAGTPTCKIAAFEHPGEKIYGLQFHPEVESTTGGLRILRNFLYAVCGAAGDYTMEDYLKRQIEAVQAQVGGGKVILGLSGGVDSSVCAALLSRAVSKNLICIFVDHGFMRKGEAEQIAQTFSKWDLQFVMVDASERFLEKLRGVTDPEQKRKIIGKEFVAVFEEQSARFGDAEFLAQGTIYPDIIESGGDQAAVIKSHHNVGGLPKDIKFKGIVEPLRGLFKDEVRKIGRLLKLPRAIVNRQPFPGPGLAIRIIGEITREKLSLLKEADAIMRYEIGKSKGKASQYFAVLTNLRSVGVMGDDRTYDYTVALRAVITNDFMTCEYAKLPHTLLSKISLRITNEVKGVNRVVYDITGKPPATIEWE